MTKVSMNGIPAAMADALAWASMIGDPARPINILPYRYAPDGGKRPMANDWARWHGGAKRRDGSVFVDAQTTGLWREWARAAERTSSAAWALLPGALGVVVVDVDAPHLLGHVLDTYGDTSVGVSTPRGGTHLYYRVDPDAPTPVSRVAIVGAGSYDVKSIGGTSHAPGSHRPDGTPYEAVAPGVVGGVLRVDRRPVLEAGALHRLLPVFPVAAYEAEWSAHHRATDDLPVDGEPRYATAEDAPSLLTYMHAAGPAVSGGGGHDHTFKLLRKIGDLGASEDMALELALEWDLGNEPPWGPLDISKKVRDAYARRKSPIGWRIEELANAGDVVEDDYELAVACLQSLVKGANDEIQ